MAVFKYLFTLIIIMMMFGCETFLVHRTGMLNDPKDKCSFAVESNDSYLKLAVETALSNKNIKVKTLEPYNVYGGLVSNKTKTKNMSVMESVTLGMRENGKIKGSKKLFNEIKEWNNIKDETIRTKDYRDLITEKDKTMAFISKVYGITHILNVQRDDTPFSDKFRYIAKLIAIPENRVDFILYVETSEDDFDKVIPKDWVPTYTGTVKENSSLYDYPEQFYNLRFAECLVRKMTGEK